MSNSARIWAVSIVKNEQDIIVQQIKHLYNQGISGCIVADNLSTDGTYELLKSLDYPNLDVIIDKNGTHHQNRAIFQLAQIAAKKVGITNLWIVPFEADNFICSPQGTIKDVLINLPIDIEAIACDVYTHFLTEKSNMSESNPLKRMPYRENWLPDEQVYHTGRNRRQVQTCYRYKSGRLVTLGFHFAFDGGQQNQIPMPRHPRMMTRHYQVRSREHFIAKYKKWAETMSESDRRGMHHAGTSGIHRYYGRMLREDFSKAMELFEKDFVKQSKDLMFDPFVI